MGRPGARCQEKPVSKIKIQYNEEEMGDSFYRNIVSKQGLPGIGTLKYVHREHLCFNWVPDFIAADRLPDIPITNLQEFIYAHILEVFGKNLQLLSISIEYLLDSFQSSRKYHHLSILKKDIYQSIIALLKLGYIEVLKEGEYYISNHTPHHDITIWTFELKLHDLKYAISQAERNLSFTDKSVIVVPPFMKLEDDPLLENIIEIGIGVATFNPKSYQFNMIIHPKDNPEYKYKEHNRTQLIASLLYDNKQCNALSQRRRRRRSLKYSIKESINV